jgi:hypothetical protein
MNIEMFIFSLQSAYSQHSGSNSLFGGHMAELAFSARHWKVLLRTLRSYHTFPIAHARFSRHFLGNFNQCHQLSKMFNGSSARRDMFSGKTTPS